MKKKFLKIFYDFLNGGRERGLLDKHNLPEILEILKKLNTSLTNLDRIHPGQTIVIPLTIAPAGGILPSAPAPKKKDSAPSVKVETVGTEKLEKLDLEKYTILPGDNLVKVINERSGSAHPEFYEKYLRAVKRLNPLMDDMNLIYPGQVV